VRPGKAGQSPRCSPRVAGFTLADLLAVVAVACVASAVAVTQLMSSRQKSALAQCVQNVSQVNRAVIAYAADHNETLPGVAPSQRNLWWWYKEQVKGYAGLSGPSCAPDKVFGCPDDRGYTDTIPFRMNGRFDFSSYVFNGVTLPGMPSVAGWRIPAINRPNRTLLVMEWTAHAPLSWHRSRTGQKNMPFYCDAESVAGFVDGRVALTKFYYDGFNAAYTQDPIPGYDYQYSGN
jgi:type II secretory pathway pseudopilin PulG